MLIIIIIFYSSEFLVVDVCGKVYQIDEKKAITKDCCIFSCNNNEVFFIFYIFFVNFFVNFLKFFFVNFFFCKFFLDFRYCIYTFTQFNIASFINRTIYFINKAAKSCG